MGGTKNLSPDRPHEAECFKKYVRDAMRGGMDPLVGLRCYRELDTKNERTKMFVARVSDWANWSSDVADERPIAAYVQYYNHLASTATPKGWFHRLLRIAGPNGIFSLLRGEKLPRMAEQV